MNRQQFLRRSALLSLAAAGLPRLASALPQSGSESEVTFRNTGLQLSSGKLADMQVELMESLFSGAKAIEHYELTLQVQMQADPKSTTDYILERKGKPAKVGDYFVGSFKVLTISGDDVIGSTLPKTIRMKLSPGETLLVELKKDSFVTLSAATEECFLTTACTAARGLPDDCAELTILRSLRDGYMKPQESGASLVEEYYRIAPAIVRRVNACINRADVWDLVYNDLVTPAIVLIGANRKADAVRLYEEYVGWMKEVFLTE